MKIREELILKALAGEETKVELAAKYGVSRKTLYKWLDRYKERGLAGLVDESRRPRSSPMMTSPELALAAMQLRQFTPVEPNDLWTVDFKGWWPYPRSDGPPPPRSGWPPQPDPIGCTCLHPGSVSPPSDMLTSAHVSKATVVSSRRPAQG